MTDLGLFNFVKSAVAQGKSKEQISATLSTAGWSQVDIDQAYNDASNNNPPVTNKTDTSALAMRFRDTDFGRPTIITALCGYYFVSWILSVLNYFVLLVSLSQTTVSFTPSFNANSLPTFLISLASILAIFGYWNMKKWGVYLFTVAQFALVIYVFANNHITSGAAVFSMVLGLLLPITMMYVGFKYLERMS